MSSHLRTTTTRCGFGVVEVVDGRHMPRIRAHIRALNAAGRSNAWIADAAGTSRSTISVVTTDPRRRLKVDLAERLLALNPATSTAGRHRHPNGGKTMILRKCTECGRTFERAAKGRQARKTHLCSKACCDANLRRRQELLIDRARDAEIVSMYQRGDPIADICKRFDFSATSIYRALSRCGVPMRGMRHAGGQVNKRYSEIADMYQHGASAKAIAEKHDISDSTVYHALRRTRTPYRKSYTGSYRRRFTQRPAPVPG